MRINTRQRAFRVSQAYQAVDGRWSVDLDIFSEVGVFKFRVTPIQAARIASDLLSTWRVWETMMKNPSGGKYG